MSRWKLAGINFDHFHMGDNLRMAREHPDVEIVAICDAAREKMADAARAFDIFEERIYTDWQECVSATKPDIVLLCPSTAEHSLWLERIAPFGAHIIMEKPFAATLSEADAMISAMRATGKQLAINWPLAWYPVHQTAKRLINQGAIGTVLEVHYYDGNRGPLWHVANKKERTREEVNREKPNSWFYQAEAGGGSLLDYLGYGATLGSWFMDDRIPIEVTCTVDQPPGLEVDEHSIAVVRYDTGLSKMETRWGTFTDPWTHQPQPKCGFILVGSAGTLSSFDYEPHVTLQDSDCPEGRTITADAIGPPFQNPIQYVIDCLERDVNIAGPLSLPTSRIGQQIVDTAFKSAQEKRTLPLVT